MVRETSCLLFSAALTLAVWPQQREISARDAFYSAAGSSAPAESSRRAAPAHPTTITAQPPNIAAPGSLAISAITPLGLRYSILQQTSSGRAAEVSPDRVFQSGDRIRLSIEANDTARLYIVQRGSSGNWSLLFPSPEISNGENLIERGKHYEIPPGHWFAFDEQPGAEKIFIVLSREPQPDLEKMIYALRDSETKPSKTLLAGGARSIDDALIGKIRGQVASRDLIFEKVDENTNDKKENAVYVVNKSAGPAASVVADVSLKHK